MPDVTLTYKGQTILEQENKRLNAVLEYVAMMADVDIDDEEGENDAQ